MKPVSFDVHYFIVTRPNRSCSAEFSNRNRNLEIYTASMKAKSREPAYSQALNPNKIDRHSIGSVDGYGGWCLKSNWRCKEMIEECG